MSHLKSNTRKEPEPIVISLATSSLRRYCDRCHLSTPKSNPRCIHCRHLLTTGNIPCSSMHPRVA